MRRSFRAVPLLFVILAGGATAVAGCSRSPQPLVTPSAGPSPVPTAGDGLPVADEPPGTATRHLLRAAVTSATLMDPGVVEAIAKASSTADAPVAESAQRLAAAYAAAVTAKGSDTEPDAVAAVSASGVAMSSVCDDSGLDTVG